MQTKILCLGQDWKDMGLAETEKREKIATFYRIGICPIDKGDVKILWGFPASFLFEILLTFRTLQKDVLFIFVMNDGCSCIYISQCSTFSMGDYLCILSSLL
jgi:hypothetical protein